MKVWPLRLLILGSATCLIPKAKKVTLHQPLQGHSSHNFSDLLGHHASALFLALAWVRPTPSALSTFSHLPLLICFKPCQAPPNTCLPKWHYWAPHFVLTLFHHRTLECIPESPIWLIDGSALKTTPSQAKSLKAAMKTSSPALWEVTEVAALPTRTHHTHWSSTSQKR